MLEPFLYWMMSVQDELLPLEVLIKMIHAPDCGGGFQQEWRIVFFVVFQLA